MPPVDLEKRFDLCYPPEFNKEEHDNHCMEFDVDPQDYISSCPSSYIPTPLHLDINDCKKYISYDLCYIGFIGSGVWTSDKRPIPLFKLGRTINIYKRRIDHINDYGNFTLLHVFLTDNSSFLECKFKNYLNKLRLRRILKPINPNTKVEAHIELFTITSKYNIVVIKNLLESIIKHYHIPTNILLTQEEVKTKRKNTTSNMLKICYTLLNYNRKLEYIKKLLSKHTQNYLQHYHTASDIDDLYDYLNKPITKYLNETDTLEMYVRVIQQSKLKSNVDRYKKLLSCQNLEITLISEDSSTESELYDSNEINSLTSNNLVQIILLLLFIIYQNYHTCHRTIENQATSRSISTYAYI